MSNRMNRLERSYDDFNRDYSKLRRLMTHTLREEAEDAPEAQLMLKIVDDLDAVLDEIVLTLKEVDLKLDTIIKE